MMLTIPFCFEWAELVPVFLFYFFPLQRVYAMGDVYPSATKLPKGEYNLRLYLRYGPISEAAQNVFKFTYNNQFSL
jgi:hypothetical protein